jgi:hypothetical protein
MPIPTTNFGWTPPVVLGDTGAWATKLNAVFDAIDAALKSVQNTASAALAKAGGAMTGRLDAKTATMSRVDLGAISGAQDLDLSAGQYFTLTVGGALSPSFSNKPTGQFAYGVMLRITNGGSSVITWPPEVKWPSASPPVLTAAGIDIVVLLTDDNGVTFRAMLVAKDVR